MFLRPEQGVLIEQLRRRSDDLADMYYGGLCVLADEKNPFCFQLAAHAFREVIAHCTRLTGESVVFGDNMPSRLVPVKEAFLEWKRVAGGADSAASLVGVSDGLREALEQFFDWQERNRPQARKRTALMLTQLAGAAPPLPSDVVAGELSAWMKAGDYFKLVAHNKHRPNRDDFVAKLFQIEDILLRRMQPRPVTDLSEIDELLAEANDAE